MKMFLAGVETLSPTNYKLVEGGYNLISFYSVNKNSAHIINKSKMFLLDSGAFSFLNSAKEANWDEYVFEYCEFIKQHNIDYFFELDIDSVIGYEKVKYYRRKIEEATNKQCIPAWHKSRGIEEWKKLCDEYPYVAIGGIVSREIKPSQYKAFPMMINEAHKRGAKVHGLGFTSTKLLKTIHFDSVDSTNWSYGRYGHYWEFTKGHDMLMHHRPLNKKGGDGVKLQAHNLSEWIKFQKYAEVNL